MGSLERLGQDLYFGLGVAESEINDDEVVRPVELRPEVEVAGGVLPVVDLDARVTRGEGVEEGREAVLLQIGDLPLDLLVPAAKVWLSHHCLMSCVSCTGRPDRMWMSQEMEGN